MDLFVKHKIKGEILDLYINPELTVITEFNKTYMPKVSLDQTVKKYIQAKLPEVKANSVNIMLHSVLLGTVRLG